MRFAACGALWLVLWGAVMSHALAVEPAAQRAMDRCKGVQIELGGPRLSNNQRFWHFSFLLKNRVEI